MEPPASGPLADAEHERGGHAIGCEACQSVLNGTGQREVSYMLLDGTVTPLVGCDMHIQQFTEVCGLTSEETATSLAHRPAGGVRCPGCRLASYEPGYPMLPVGDGCVAILACSSHQSQAIERFQTGLRTRQRLTTDLRAGRIE